MEPTFRLEHVQLHKGGLEPTLQSAGGSELCHLRALTPAAPHSFEGPTRPTSITRLLRIFSSSSENDLEAKGGCPKRASVEGRQRAGWEGIGSSWAWPTPGEGPQTRRVRVLIKTLQEWPSDALPEETQCRPPRGGRGQSSHHTG